MTETEFDWPSALRSANNGAQTAAVSALRDLLIRGLHVALKGRGQAVGDAEIEDFAQEGLLRVLNRLDQFEGRSRFTTWAMSIAINTAWSTLRRKHWQDVSLETLVSSGARLSDPAALPDRAFAGNEDRNRIVTTLRHAIARHLTPKQRAAILAELSEMPFDQIVALLGTNRNAVYKLVHDARRALKRHLHDAGITAQDIRTAFD
jgi:RNA polymerase sigma-70 factor (ECF subfamily)